MAEKICQTLQRKNHQLSTKVKDTNNELLKLHQILDKSPVSIVITDIDGNIEYANPSFTEVTGYTIEEVIGQNPRVLKSDIHSDEYYATLWEDITHNKVWNGTFKNISKSGREYWESAIIAPVNNENGELSNFMAIKQEITQQVYLEDKLFKQDKEKIENFEKTLESFVGMVEQRDTYTAGHSNRMAEYAKLIALEMGYSQEECELLYRASILHDIGKIATPDNVLLKPGKLSKLEYKLIQEHVVASYDILARIPMYKNLADIIISHHERYDGKGYPHGLKEDEIHPLSQIMIVADAFDAMTTNRIYKGRMNIAEAIEELKKCSGTQFHPTVVKSAIKALKNVELYDTVNQLPKTDLEKERFSYFYRDQVTKVYNSDYLKFILSQNKFDKEYICINTLYMHNFHQYNKINGWNKGDKLLDSFAEYLIANFESSLIFRIYGNDFVLLSKEHQDIDMEKLNKLKILTENNITLSNYHINSREKDIVEIDMLFKNQISVDPNFRSIVTSKGHQDFSVIRTFYFSISISDGSFIRSINLVKIKQTSFSCFSLFPLYIAIHPGVGFAKFYLLFRWILFIKARRSKVRKISLCSRIKRTNYHPVIYKPGFLFCHLYQILHIVRN